MQEIIDFLGSVDSYCPGGAQATGSVSRKEGQHQPRSVKCQQLLVDFTAAADDGEHRPGHG